MNGVHQFVTSWVPFGYRLVTGRVPVGYRLGTGMVPCGYRWTYGTGKLPNRGERVNTFPPFIVVKCMHGKICDPFYQTPAWRRLRKMVLERDHYLCQECLRRFERGYGMRPRAATVVHHIIQRSERPDLELTIENLESICAECHNREHPEKKMSEAQKREADRRKELTKGARIIRIGENNGH